MKKFLAIFTITAVLFGLVITPALAYDNNNKKANSIEKTLKKAQSDLKKALSDQVKLEATIQKAIAKSKTDAANAQKKALDPSEQQKKWQAELDKAAAQDKVEMDNLIKDIAKKTQTCQSQLTALNKQLLNIDTQLNKQITDLNTKLAATTDAAAKTKITASIANAQKYAAQRKDAINTYLAALQKLFVDKQALWNQQKAILTTSQSIDLAYRTSMTNIKKAELADKIANSVPDAPKTDNTEAKIRAKYQAQVDLLKIKVKNLNDLINDLQAKLK